MKEKYISLKQAAKISGYAPDYIGWLIRNGKIKGRKVYSDFSWQTTEKALRNYQKNNKKRQMHK